LNTLLFIHYIR